LMTLLVPQSSNTKSKSSVMAEAEMNARFRRMHAKG
jgi:hypothetical protein